MKKDGESKGRVLAVEDDPITLKIISAMLQNAGYHSHSAVDGRKCLEMVHSVCPDVILMDIVMPAMDGVEVCRQLKQDQELAQIPIIFVTASTDDQTLQAAFDAGGSDFVRKPISRVELLARVQSVLAQRRAAQKLAEDQKLKGMLETAGGVCHELNQPLQYILGAVQILMMDTAPEDPVYQSLDNIFKRVSQMGEITRKLTAITQYRTRKYAGGHEILDIDGCSGNPTGEH